MLVYKDSTCSTTECCRNTYVVMDLRSHKNRPSLERWYKWSSRASTNWIKACSISVEVIWSCPKKISRHVQRLSVVEIRILWWICGHTRMDRVRNNDMRNRLEVAPIEEKLVQHRLRWFGHVQRRPPEAPVHCEVLSQVNNMRRGRGRLKLTWGRQ